MTTGDTQPTRPLPDRAYSEPSPRRRRRWLGWLIALIIVAALAVGALFLGEWIARDLVTKAIRDQVVTRLGLPAGQDVDVAVGGTVLPQLVAGRLDDVTVSSTDVALGDALTGDVTVRASGVDFRGDASAQAATATVELDEAQVRTLMQTVEGFPADTLGLAEPNVTVATELTFFGARLPVGVGLTPTAQDGDLVLTPATLQLGDAEISADDLRNRFGGVADAALRDYTVCVAQYIPAALTMTDVVVAGDELVADLSIDPGIITDPALQANGTCG